MSVSDPHINSEKRGALGLLTLSRPAALNALNHGMIRALAAQLADWAHDGDIKTVAIRGAGDRGFCSGGDVSGSTQKDDRPVFRNKQMGHGEEMRVGMHRVQPYVRQALYVTRRAMLGMSPALQAGRVATSAWVPG